MAAIASPSNGLPPTIKMFKRTPFFRGKAFATEHDAKIEAASHRRSGLKTVIYPFNGTYSVYHTY